MTTKPQKPADLDNTKLHTREEYRRWQEANYEYAAALQAEQRREEMKAEAAKAEANRILTEEEYRALAVKRENEKQAKQAERDAAENAAVEAKAAYLASSPEVAEIEATNPYHFIAQVVHWANRGYEMPEGTDVHALPSFYAVKLTKPAKKAAK